MRHLTLAVTALAVACALPPDAVAQKKVKKIATTPAVISITAPAERMAGVQQRQKLADASLIKNIPFRSVGPTVMSGRVVDLDVNPDNPTQFYVAYASGGLWRTDNNGISFTPLFDNEAVMTIGAIAVDWKNNTIWIGTGESNASRSSYAGLGMYKSLDGGKTWQHLGLADSHHIGRIVLHPTNPNTAWVAAVGHLYTPNPERGIYKTTDGGKTWAKTLYIDDKTGAIDVDIDPANPQVLYASMWHKERRAWNFVEGGKTSGIYKSTDGGTTWKLITGGSSGFPQDENSGRIGLSIFPKSTNTLYAILDNQTARPKKEQKNDPHKLTKDQLRVMSKDDFLKAEDAVLTEYLDEQNFPEKYTAKSLKELVQSDKIKPIAVLEYTDDANSRIINTDVIGAEVYRSDDAGQSWRKVNADYLDGLYNTYGYYFGNVWIAPDNADKIVIAGVPVIRSEDGGKTYKGMDNGNVHADHHALWINPKNNNHMILGNDGGVNITYDNGKTWFKANTPAVAQFYAIAVDMAKPYNVYGGLQDNGVWFGPGNYKASYDWFDGGQYPYKRLLGGDGMQVQVDWRDNNTVYTGFQFGNYFRINRQTGEMKRLTVPQEVGEAKLRWNWQAPILLSRHNQDVVYFGSNRFHRSMNRGDEFKTLSGDLTKGLKTGDVSFGTLTTIDESPLKFGLLYVGSDDGLVHVSQDGGYTWTRISDKLPQDLWVSRVTASAHDEGTVYVSLNGYRDDHFNAYVFRSTDYGQTWQPIGTDLPMEPVNVVKEDPKNSNIMYVGTDHGVYVSLNKGRTFMHLNGGMPAVAVHDLVVHPRDNDLIVGTHGRSLYIGSVEHLQQLTDTLTNKPIHIFALKPASYSPNWGRMYNKYEEAPAYKFELPFYVKTAGKTTVRLTTDKGLTLKTLTDDSEAGLNYLTYDYSVDASVAEGYQKYLNDTRKKDEKEVDLKPADDKKVYLRPGKYTFVFETSSGAKAEKEWELKAPERRSRRAITLPNAYGSPGEFEEWMEEMSVEETK
ncbi:WD40/YVTN/BNR-like repeat-containing protein [Nibrella viscosa]